MKVVGITPDGMLGHSVGELTCGYADGCLTREQTLQAAVVRGRCIEDAKLPNGAMAATGTGIFSNIALINVHFSYKGIMFSVDRTTLFTHYLFFQSFFLGVGGIVFRT